jgi:transposase
VWRGHKYLTVVYQIDQGVRRLLWVGKERTVESFRGFFAMFGKARSRALRFIASDMWKPYLDVIAELASQAVHVLDRFHIVANMNKAVDEVRAGEARDLVRQGYEPILKHTRWCFLKRPENLNDAQRAKLADVLKYDLRSVRAYLLRESLEAFWRYTTAVAAGWFFDKWCTPCAAVPPQAHQEVRTLAAPPSRPDPQLVRRQEGNLGRRRRGLNANAKLALRKARGFRTFEVLETALYHELGRLPEPPEITHRFC